MAHTSDPDAYPRLKTPPPSAGLPQLPSSTPIKPKDPTKRLFSTFTLFRHPTLNNIGKGMVDSLVGPMPVEDFLNRYLPISDIPGYSSVASQFKAGVSFQRSIQAESEMEMYKPFIEDVQPFAPNLALVDSHARGDKQNGYDFEIKPDISVYHRMHNGSLAGPSGPTPLGCKTSQLDMHVEFKWLFSDDPFLIPSNPPGSRDNEAFIGTTEYQADTLGQIGVYISAQLASQFRTHTFSVLVVRDTARIIRWDREGAVVTEPILYAEKSYLAEFFARYSMAPPDLRGFDTTVSLASEEEASLARTKLGLPSRAPMFKTTIPENGGGPPLIVIFPLPDVFPSTPACRGTRACPAYDLCGDRVVFLKDSWRVNGPDMLPEGEIYTNLNKHNVPHVPTCLASGDVLCCPEQETQTWKSAQFPWACRKRVSITSHTHYRLVLDIVGEPLSNFTSSKELVQAIHDALVGHEKAFELGYLHRDISTGNIIIFDGRGWLIDWDLAKATGTLKRRQLTRTGTWQFMSARLVEDSTAEHTYRDDLESSFWVLLWTAVMFSKSSMEIEERSTFVRNIFEGAPGTEGKRSLLVSQNKLKPNLFSDRPLLFNLLKDMADLFGHDYYVPGDHEWEYLKVEDPSEREIELMAALPVFRHQQARQRLANHKYVIGCYKTQLNSKPWPENDPAAAQPLTRLNCWGNQDSGHVVVLKSKQVAVRMQDDGGRRSHKRLKLSAPES